MDRDETSDEEAGGGRVNGDNESGGRVCFRKSRQKTQWVLVVLGRKKNPKVTRNQVGAGTGESGDESANGSKGDGSMESAEDGEDDGSTAESETKNAPASGSDAGENGSETKGEVPDTGSTQEAMDRSSQALVNTDAPDVVYGTAPKANLKNLIHDYSKVIEDFAAAGISDQWMIRVNSTTLSGKARLASRWCDGGD